ncbi:MAG: chloride channel protein, partial [Planctomycetales bacterium]|nr:chloride channel protein [Planctomycetales bacterium]
MDPEPSASPANSPPGKSLWLDRLSGRIVASLPAGAENSGWLTVLIAGVIGVLGGFGAALFTWLIDLVHELTLGHVLHWAANDGLRLAALIVPTSLGMLLVAWITKRFAPEAQGHGVPEVITAVARHDGRIRPVVVVIKAVASALSIGTGASVGREGPIVQIGSALGSSIGQVFRLSARHINVLVAAGAAAGISATFNAPLAGVIFASEIILGSFAVESLTPIVIASVLADVVQQHIGEHGVEPAFRGLHEFNFEGAWQQLPSYAILGLLAGLAAASFTKLTYWTEDKAEAWFPNWMTRALVLGAAVGIAGALYPRTPPAASPAVLAAEASETPKFPVPPLLGGGYGVMDHVLHLHMAASEDGPEAEPPLPLVTARKLLRRLVEGDESRKAVVQAEQIWSEFWWILLLVFLKPLATSISLAGGGSGGIFAPSLYLGATLGAA